MTRVEQPKKLQVRHSKKGRIGLFPTINLTGGGRKREAVLTGNGWDKHYKKAAAKLAQDVTFQIAPEIEDLLRKIQRTDYLNSLRGGEREPLLKAPIESYIDSPQSTARLLARYAETYKVPAVMEIANAMWQDPTGSNRLTGSNYGGIDRGVAEKTTTIADLDTLGNLAAGPLSRVHPLAGFLSNWGPAGLAIHEASKDQTFQNRRDAIKHLIDRADAQMDYINADTELRVADEADVAPEYLAKVQKRVADAEANVHKVMSTAPGFSANQAAAQQKLEDKGRADRSLMAADATNYLLSPKLMGAFNLGADILADTSGRQARTAAMNTGVVSTSSESLIGQTLAQPAVYGQDEEGNPLYYEAGEEVTPEMVEHLRASGVSDVTATAPETWRQFALRYGDSASTALAQTVAAQQARAGVSNFAQNVSARGQQWLNAAKKGRKGTRAAQAARSVAKLRVALNTAARSSNSRLARFAAKGAKNLLNMGRTAQTAKAGGKVMGRFGGRALPALGIAMSLWDIEEGLSSSGQDRIRKAVEDRWIYQEENPGIGGQAAQSLSDLWAIPKGLLYDNTDAQAALADDPNIVSLFGSPEAYEAEKERFLKDFRYAKATASKYAGMYDGLSKALPGMTPMQLEVLAASAATRAADIEFGNEPAEREVGSDEHELLSLNSNLSSDQQAQMRDIIRLAGPDAFVTAFYGQGEDGTAYADPTAWMALERGSEMGVRVPQNNALWRDPLGKQVRETKQKGTERSQQEQRSAHERRLGKLRQQQVTQQQRAEQERAQRRQQQQQQQAKYDAFAQEQQEQQRAYQALQAQDQSNFMQMIDRVGQGQAAQAQAVAKQPVQTPLVDQPAGVSDNAPMVKRPAMQPEPDLQGAMSQLRSQGVVRGSS